jgi:hypothetical protein
MAFPASLKCRVLQEDVVPTKKHFLYTTSLALSPKFVGEKKNTIAGVMSAVFMLLRLPLGALVPALSPSLSRHPINIIIE